jgi:gas vesicle protein
MSRENSSSGVLVGAIVGGAIGAISALLFAPKAGTDLREDISSKFKSISEKTKDLAAAVGQNTKDLAVNIKEEAGGLMEHAKQSNQNVMNSITSAKDDLKEDLSTADR